MIWAGEGAEDHKKKREKENTGLVGNCSGGWERGRAYGKDSAARCVRNVLAAAACREVGGCMGGWVGRASERAGGKNRRPVESLKPADR